MEPLILTPDNYYSKEANIAYMSASQMKAFMACESAALAELFGERTREISTALLVGSYIDAYFSGELSQFKMLYPQIFTKNGELKSDYRNADKIIQRIERDPLFMAMLSGQKQVVCTGSIAGIPFKCKIDCLLSESDCDWIAEDYPGVAPFMAYQNGAIIDMKVMKDFRSIWMPGIGRVSFVEAWRYDMQLAIYQEIAGGRLPCFIAGATKEPEPDIEVFYFQQADLDDVMREVEELAPRFAAIKTGRIEPVPCGQCDYCRARKTLERPADYKLNLEADDE